MVGSMRAHRKRQPMTIDYRHDFHAFSALCCSDFCATAFTHHKGRIDEAFFFVEPASVAKLVISQSISNFHFFLDVANLV